jgi:hypothetical protein
VSFAYIFVNYASILFQHQYTLLPNMSKKNAALEAKFEIAVKTLLKAPNLTVQEAMLAAKFSTKDIENKSMHKIIAGAFPAAREQWRHCSLPPRDDRHNNQKVREVRGEEEDGCVGGRDGGRGGGGRQRGRGPEQGDGGTGAAQSS